MKRKRRRKRKHRKSSRAVSMRGWEIAQMHYAKGEDALDSGDVETAIGEFSLSLRRDPYLDTAYFGMGTAYAMSQEPDEAYRYLKHAIELNPGEEVYYHNLGNVCLQLMRIGEAYRCYQKYLKLAPDGDQAKEMRKKVKLIEKGMRKDAQERNLELSIEEILEQEAIFQAGFDKMSHGSYDEAIACFERVLQVDPNHHQSYGNMGVALMGKGDYERAEQMLRKALQLEPSYEPAKRNLLACQRRAQSEIITEFQTGKYFSVSDEKAELPMPPAKTLARDLMNKGADYLTMDRLQSAIACLQKAWELDAGNVSIAINLGSAYVQDEQYESAVQVMEAANAKSPKDAFLKTNLGVAYLGLSLERSDNNFEEKAKALFEEAIRLDKRLPQPYHDLAAIYYEQGDLAQAAEALKDGLKQHPQDIEMRKLLEKIQKEGLKC